MKRHTNKKNNPVNNIEDNHIDSGIKYQEKEYLQYDNVTLEWYEFFYTFSICCCLAISCYSINLKVLILSVLN